MLGILFLVGVWLGSGRAQDIKTFESYLRLGVNETVEMEVNTKNPRFRSVLASLDQLYPLPYPANVSNTTQNQNWNLTGPWKYSVSDDDCKVDTFFNDVSQLFSFFDATQSDAYAKLADYTGQPPSAWKTQILFYQVINRTMVFSEGKIYLSSVYYFSFGDGANWYNAFETLAISYNASTISQVELVGVVNETYFNDYKTNASVCIWARYVPGYNETVTIWARFSFVNVSNDGSGDPVMGEVRMGVRFYFVRPKLNREFLLMERAIGSDYQFRSDSVVAGVELTPDSVYELMFYLLNLNDMVVLNFNALEVFGVQTLKFPFPVMQTNYATRSLWLIYTEFPEVGMRARRSYFLNRYPGSSLDLSALTLYSDSRYISTLPTEETIDVIIEGVNYDQNTAVMGGAGGSMPVVLYTLHRYSAQERKMEGLASMFLNVDVRGNVKGLIYRAESFSGLTDSSLALNSLFLDYNYAPPTVSRYFVPVGVDLYMGLGSKVYPVNATYNLYTDQMQRDPWTGHFFLFPFASPLSAGNLTNRQCRFFRQRKGKVMLNIQNTQGNDTFFPYLNILLQDADNQPTRVLLKTQFLSLDTLREQGYPLWRGSNLTQLEVNSNFDRRNIDLDFLVRGSFIVRRLPDYPPTVDYLPLSLQALSALTRHSFYQVDSLRIPEVSDLILGGIDFVFALDKTSLTQGLQGSYLFLRPTDTPNVQLYFCVGGVMTRQPDLPSFPPPKRILMVSHNLYLVFSTGGGMQTFDAHTALLTPLYYPGVDCLDIERVYSTRLKPSLLCLNQNFQLVVYLLDELITRSLSNSMLTPHMPPDPPLPYLTPLSTLLSSPHHLNRIFVLTKTPSGRAHLTLLYLDLTDSPRLSIQTHLELINADPDNTGIPARVQGALFIRDKLLVLYRAMLTYTWLNLGEFTDAYQWKVTKAWRLPPDIETGEDASLSLFNRHLLSPLYVSDTRPYALLPVNIQGGMNVLVIDPLAPLLESMPTFLLPRHSQGPSLTLFPLHTSKLDSYRYYSAGLLHWNRNPKGTYRDDARPYYLFQFIRADRPRVYFQSTPAQTSHFGYRTLYLSFHNSTSSTLSFSFESHLALGSSPVVDTQISLVPRRPIPPQATGPLLFSDLTLSLRDSYTKSSGHSPLKLFSWRFAELYRGTVFDWVTAPEGFFDLLVGTFAFRKPLELKREFSMLGLNTLDNIDTFCARYSLVEGLLRCSRRGWVFFYEAEVEVFYQEGLASLHASSAVRFKFNPNECTRSVVNNHTLMTFCFNGLNKYILQTDLIDQSQTTLPMQTLNLDPLFTEAKVPPRPLTPLYPDFLFEYAKLLTDSMNANYTSKQYYFFSRLSFNLSLLQACASPFNYTTTLVKSFDTSANTEGTGLTFQPSLSPDRQYRFSSILLNTGNLVSALVTESASTEGYLSPLTSGKTYFNDQPTSGINKLVFGFNSTKDVKAITLSSPRVEEIILSDADPVLQGPNQFQRLSMVRLPSYHSFLLRHSGSFHLYNLSVYKLENPFAEIQNLYWDKRPVCMRWACLLVAQFGDGQQFLLVYDLSPETTLNNTRPPNFNDIFGTSIGVDGKFPAFFDFDSVPSNYTFYPIQVLNLTDLRLAKLEPTEEASPSSLTLLLYFNSGRVMHYTLNRFTELSASNLYFGSRFVEFNALTNFHSQKTFRLTLDPWTEGDYPKYYTILMAATLVSFLACALSLKVIRAQTPPPPPPSPLNRDETEETLPLQR